MNLLIDADYIVYKACAGAETEIDFGDDVIVVTSRFSEALQNVKNDLNKLAEKFWTQSIILFFSDSKNFRKSIDTSYKGHRNRKKPCAYKRVINALGKEYETIILPTLEADDALGIYATAHPGNVLCSPDKDMRQIPGQLYDMNEVQTITKEEGDRWHLIQAMAGDQTDGYSGVPGIGIKRAVTLFEEHGYNWDTVVKAFAAKDLGEDVALQNARLAKILQKENYDFGTQQPILWEPPTTTNHKANDGAGVQATAA